MKTIVHPQAMTAAMIINVATVRPFTVPPRSLGSRILLRPSVQSRS
jgi:hypothetical protein